MMRQHEGHLSDDQLIEVCLDGSTGASARAHLDACPGCTTRRTQLDRLLTDASAVAAAEADAIFTPERLARQRARIAQRVDHEGRPGRVVVFPAGQVRPSTPLRTRPGMRWVAGAAAAGLVIGMLAGQYTGEFRRFGARPVASLAVTEPAVGLQTVSMTMSEEEFLGHLEMVIDGTGGSTLQPLHDMTPLTWEVSAP